MCPVGLKACSFWRPVGFGGLKALEVGGFGGLGAGGLEDLKAWRLWRPGCFLGLATLEA